MTSGLTSLEALGLAIRREIDAGQVFRNLATGCANSLTRDRFLLLARESAQQEQLLRDRYAALFPSVPLAVPPSPGPLPEPALAPDRNAGLRAALRFAADTERQAREFYLEASNEAADPTAQAMYRYLADVHGRRQAHIEAEYDVIVRYPFAFDDAPTPWRPEIRLRAG
jgi:rubrerythrin